MAYMVSSAIMAAYGPRLATWKHLSCVLTGLDVDDSDDLLENELSWTSVLFNN